MENLVEMTIFWTVWVQQEVENMKQDLLDKRNGRFCERSAESLPRPKDRENYNWAISEGHGSSEEKSNVVGVKGEDKANK